MKSIFRTPVFFFPALLFCLLSLLTACQPDGGVGPKGQPGETGAAGPAGDKGPAGSLYYKAGFVRCTLTGTGKDGVTPINETFNYEFSGSRLPLIFTGDPDGHFFYLTRYDSTGVGSFSMSFTASTDFTTAKVRSIYLRVLKKVGATQFKEITGDLNVYGQNAVVPATLTQLSYNPVTGLLTGNFTWRAEPEAQATGPFQYFSRTSTGQPYTVTGSFSIVARKGTY